MKTVAKSMERSIRKNAFNLFLFLCTQSFDSLVNLINEELAKLDFDSPSSARRKIAYHNKLGRYSVEEDVSLSQFPSMDLSYNRIRLKI